MYSDKLHVLKIKTKIDSLIQLREKTISRLNGELESLKKKTVDKLNQKLNDLGLPSQAKEKIASLTADIENFTIPPIDLEVGNVMPTSIPNNLKEFGLNPAIPELPVGNGVNVISGNVARELDLQTEINTYGADIQQLAKGDEASLDKLASTAEQHTVELAGLKDIQKDADVLGEYKEELALVQDPNGLKEEGVEQLQQAAMDHFAGKEQILQQAMDKMSKYKEKYSSLTSLANVPKRPPNEMRGKPLIERLVPAFMVQIQKEGDDLLVDFNPYIGYRFTGKFTAGPGWNQRIGYNTKVNDFTAKPRIYGPRLFAEYNLWKGFSPRVEVEVMNALVAPENQPSRMDLGTRQWVWGAFIGLKKEYRFIKNVKGTALVMTRLFDPDHKSPYADILNVRIGFEFPMKKKLKQKG